MGECEDLGKTAGGAQGPRVRGCRQGLYNRKRKAFTELGLRYFHPVWLAECFTLKWRHL